MWLATPGPGPAPHVWLWLMRVDVVMRESGHGPVLLDVVCGVLVRTSYTHSIDRSVFLSYLSPSSHPPHFPQRKACATDLHPAVPSHRFPWLRYHPGGSGGIICHPLRHTVGSSFLPGTTTKEPSARSITHTQPPPPPLLTASRI